MTEQQADQLIGESLSALADGEANELELHRLLGHGDSENIQATWERYQLVSSVMRKEYPKTVGQFDLTARISAALDDEPPVVAEKRSWWAPIGQVAIAASVALVVVVGTQFSGSLPGIGTDQQGIENRTANSALEMPSPQGYPVPAALAAGFSSTSSLQPNNASSSVPSRPRVLSAEDQRYLNQLLLLHTENAAVHNSRGMLPFARIVELEE